MQFGIGKVAAALVSTAVLAPLAPAQDAERGAAKSLQCVACHGSGGITSNPMFPHLAGQNAAYLEIQLEHFRTGQRYHPLMTPIAESLTRREMSDLAAYYSRIGGAADAASGLPTAAAADGGRGPGASGASSAAR